MFALPLAGNLRPNVLSPAKTSRAEPALAQYMLTANCALVLDAVGLQSFAFSRDSFSAINARISSDMFRSFNHCSLYKVTGKRPTWAMLLLGFAGTGFMANRRKAKPALMAAQSKIQRLRAAFGRLFVCAPCVRRCHDRRLSGRRSAAAPSSSASSSPAMARNWSSQPLST